MSRDSFRSDRSGNAVRDELTESFSRSYFIDAVGIERELALEVGKPFSVCLIDIDQLRNVNDLHGLEAGDSVIAGVADKVRSTLDLPQWQNLRCLQARFDGDSLTLLLPGCRVRRAEQFAHVLNRRIGDAVYAGSIRVTASIAVTGYKIGESTDELLARAERTMYVSKQFGGDCVETVHTPEPERRTANVTRLPVAFRSRKRAG